MSMQYTAKKPFNSVVILKEGELRYRFQEDHIFKYIRYNQITKVKVHTDLFRRYFAYLLAPFMVISQMGVGFAVGFDWIVLLNVLVWLLLMGVYLSRKKVYTVQIKKGPLTAEVYATHQLKEAKMIQKAIESHC